VVPSGGGAEGGQLPEQHRHHLGPDPRAVRQGVVRGGERTSGGTMD